MILDETNANNNNNNLVTRQTTTTQLEKDDKLMNRWTVKSGLSSLRSRSQDLGEGEGSYDSSLDDNKTIRTSNSQNGDYNNFNEKDNSEVILNLKYKEKMSLLKETVLLKKTYFRFLIPSFVLGLVSLLNPFLF